MSLVSELLQSIRFLKYMGWGKSRGCEESQIDLILANRISLDKKRKSCSRDGIGMARQRECPVEPYSVSETSGVTLP